MKNTPPTGPGLTRKLVRLALMAFPERFRDVHGEDLMAAFEDQRVDVLGRYPKVLSPLVSGAVGLRVLWQLVRAGLAERRTVAAKRNRNPGKDRKEFMLVTMMSDLKHALRGHIKSPGLPIVAILTIALGIGATTAIFSVVNGVLLRPLPYPDSDELISIQVTSRMDSGESFYNLSEPEFLDMGSRISSFADVAGYNGNEVTFGDSTAAQRIRVLATTANLFPLLGIEPSLGRTFSAEEDAPDAPGVVILSHGMWQTEFAGDRNIVGRSMIIGDEPLTIIGVMPPGFDFPFPGWDAYTPLQLDRENPWERNNHYLPTIARLAPGTTLRQARAEVDVLAAQSTQDHPEYYPNTGLRVKLQSFQESLVGAARTPLYVLLAAVGFVLLTACVNVANLLLVRGENRKREIAIRTAVGASRGRVRRQLLTESFLLAGLGGVAGLAVGTLGVKALLAMGPSALPRLEEIEVNVVVLGFSLLAAMATGLAFGVLPAMRHGNRNVHQVLKEGGDPRTSGSRSGQRLRQALVATQVVLAVVLVTGSGLMLRSVAKMYEVDMGFETENILTFRLNPSSSRYETGEERAAFYRQLLERVNSLPGVRSAGSVFSLPMTGGANNWSIIIEGRPVANVGEAPADLVQRVSPEYFDALGLTLSAGRLFTREDDAQALPVVVVSEAMAQKHWPGEDPIGKRMKVFLPDWPWMEVIGVVKDVRHRGPSQEPRPRWYVPHAQAYVSAYASPLANTIAVRSDADPTPLMAPIRSLLSEIDGSVPISNVQTMEKILDGAVGSQRFVMILLTVFGLLALFLAVVGVYGVVSYSVSRRTHEIGLRMALGAEGSSVLGQILREGLILSLVGVVVGLVGSFALSRAFESLVFGISSTDPVTYGGVVAVLVAAAVGASFLPARRASRVSPMVALRDD